VVETTTPVRRGIPTYQRQQQSARTTSTITTTSTLRQTQQKTNAMKNGRSLSGTKLTAESKIQKETTKVAAKEMPAPSVKVRKVNFSLKNEKKIA